MKRKSKGGAIETLAYVRGWRQNDDGRWFKPGVAGTFESAADAFKAEEKSKRGWRVVYGETMPAWEQIFPTRREAEAFAQEHQGFGDIIFSITRVVPGERPRSLTAAIDQGLV